MVFARVPFLIDIYAQLFSDSRKGAIGNRLELIPPIRPDRLFVLE